MRLCTLLVLVAVAGIGGCVSLPYTPDRQPPGVRISADYETVDDLLRIEIASGGRRVEAATIVTADDSEVRVLAIERTPGLTVKTGLNLGGGSSAGSSGTTGSVETPGRTTLLEGHAFAVFSAPEAGPPPWRVRVKLAGVEPVVIVVGRAKP